MRCTRLLIAISTLTLLFVGCATCDNSFDYSPPAHGGSCAPDGHGSGRLGSRISLGRSASQGETVAEDTNTDTAE